MDMWPRNRKLLFQIFDALCVVLCWLGAVLLRHGALVPLPPSRTFSTYLIYIFVLEIVVFGAFSLMNVYRGFYSPIDRVGKATLVVFLVINLISFYFQEYAHSRFMLIAFSALLFVTSSLWRIVFFLFLSTSPGKRIFQRRTLILGTGKDAGALADQIEVLPGSPFHVIGFVAVRPDDERIAAAQPVIGQLKDLHRLTRNHRIDEVLVTQDEVPLSMWPDLTDELEKREVTVRIVPWGLEDLIASPELDEPRNGIPVIEFLMEPIPAWEKLAKRVIDVGIALSLLVLLSPLLALISIFIKWDSRGPVFYFQERLGRHGRPFKLTKFRTMIENAEESTGPVWAEKNDTRATRVGTWLRRLGLDELPQIFNIVRGEMSFVGPRPERPHFAQLHPALTRRRLSVKPGLTGLAQVSLRYSLDVEDKLRFDLFYLQNFSLGLDLVILLRTMLIIVREELPRVLRRGGASRA
jgi:exopolysaccharide biosynthesis polyprenyl glycosylphosphotransferase